MQHLFDVSGRTVLVTGGSSGLGLETVRLFIDGGARVVSVARAFEPGLCDSRGEPLRDNGDCLLVEADLTEPGSVARMFTLAGERFSTPQIVVNNAGISIQERAERMSDRQFEQVMAINLNAALAVARQACLAMKADKRGGSVINISSILARRGLPGSLAYSVSKAALDQMTRSLALEWGRYGIRVNSIAAGWFESGMSSGVLGGPAGAVLKQRNPLRRLAEPRDFFGALLLLASDAGAYVNGAVIPVDGGQSLA